MGEGSFVKVGLKHGSLIGNTFHFQRMKFRVFQKQRDYVLGSFSQQFSNGLKIYVMQVLAAITVRLFYENANYSVQLNWLCLPVLSLKVWFQALHYFFLHDFLTRVKKTTIFHHEIKTDFHVNKMKLYKDSYTGIILLKNRGNLRKIC